MGSIPAFRYIDGKLVKCEDRGASMLLHAAPPVRLGRFKMPPRAVNVGAFGIDLDREGQTPGGPPSWFRPNASRRARRAAWAPLSKAAREQLGADCGALVKLPPAAVARLHGHVFRAAISGPRGASAQMDVLLYLPEGEAPAAHHERDLWEASSANEWLQDAMDTYLAALGGLRCHRRAL